MTLMQAIELGQKLAVRVARTERVPMTEDVEQEVAALVLENLDPEKDTHEQELHILALVVRALGVVKRGLNPDPEALVLGGSVENEDTMIERIDVWRAMAAVERTGIEHPRMALLDEQLVKFHAHNQLGWA